MNRVLINVGHIIGFHGLKGEIKIKSTSDYINKRLQVNNKITLYKDDDSIELVIKTHRLHKDIHLISLDGYNSLNDVERFKNYSIKVKEDELYELANDEYYYYQLINLNVYDYQDNLIGPIKKVWNTGANDVFIVDYHNKEILIPYLKDIVKEIDLNNKKVILYEVEGLLE